MKIAVLIYSRNRAQKLRTLLNVLQELESGRNEVRYFVSYCPSDTLTRYALYYGAAEAIRGICRPSDNTMIGEAINLGLRIVHHNCDPDYYTVMADDVIPLTQNWDTQLSVPLMQGISLATWDELNDPGGFGYPTFTRNFYCALAPKMFPEYFPYWFVDSWLSEVYDFAFQCLPSKNSSLILGGKRGSTQGLRDVDFWLSFFTATRPERVGAARTLQRAFGGPNTLSVSCATIRRHHTWDAFQKGKGALYEKEFGTPTDPPEAYYQAAYEAAKNHPLMRK